MRLFAALKPEEKALDHVKTALAPIRREFPVDLRWTDPENWHLTVAFYGEQPDGYFDDIADHLSRAAALQPKPLNLHLRGAGVFSHRTLWIGAGGDTSSFSELALDAELPTAGETKDQDQPRTSGKRRPHLTVARLRQQPHQRATEWDPFLSDISRALSIYRGPDFLVHEVILYESFLGQGRRGGPLYRERLRCPISSAL
ncbi:RNA 2',3'-cyclic phosphodiesterase [Corynebacterium poyangense]|uniref:RNA 2',3'-cyclic phosphodiesterase n=1 Tax=Corynebacterium poyangense TaxID=2684405 RepID=A0A7H0SQ41_9CORY|nr:RNA 2',3'-cyclic phosphodiesterase [Corynebacterium poyangense]MBZ8178398.1 RNA 2',3'-cyclic phosphodiesterase [Corynebacterium poyangense]QNQ90666.1 RNA 2',3'-cyclic phosphodiesterase [Corynebacterium poyangense]